MRNGILVLIAVLVIWAAVDLAGPAHGSLRDFDPHPVADLDTRMWRAYYDREPVPLFFELAELLRRQFHFPYLRSFVAAARATRAAFVFKAGHSRAEYDRALPDLIAYFAAIRRISTTPFDVPRAARLELEWWIVHRERGLADPEALARALADAAAALYQVPSPSLLLYGRRRAEAMEIRDRRAQQGGVREEDWRRIGSLLDDSWRSLARTVRQAPVSARRHDAGARDAGQIAA